VAAQARYIGRSLPRLEDVRLVLGAGRYTDDFSFEGEVHAVFVRADRPHARILRVDVTQAGAMAGVLRALSARDYAADGLKPVAHAANPPDALDVLRASFDPSNSSTIVEFGQPPLAGDRVRFVGEALAVVVATSAQGARDAAERVVVDYEDLPHVTEAADALAPDAPLLWEAAPGNVALRSEAGDAAAVEKAFAQAHLVLRKTFVNQRIVNCQTEPRASLARYDAQTGYEVIAGGQGVVRQRVALATALAEPAERVRLICPDVGGGFGPRTSLGVETVVVAWLARKLGRPVRWTSDRSEAFLTDFQGRDLKADVGVAFDKRGRILGLHVRQIGNLGAYPASFAPLANGVRIVTTAYAVPCVRMELQGALTNTVPTVPYRGAGRPEATFALERMLDAAARRLDIDRIEIRRRNLVTRARMPYVTAAGLTLDSGDFHANMERALDLADRRGFAARRRASAREGMLRGLGLANYIEAPVGAAREKIILRVSDQDVVEIVAGTQSTGQGHATTFAQVAADRLGLPIEAFRLVTGDTRVVSVGGGTHSDRSMRLVGALLLEACDTLMARGREMAAHAMSEAPDALVFEDGAFVGPRGRRLSLFELAGLAQSGGLPSQMGRALVAEAEIGRRIPAHPTGCAVCEIVVDPQTGVARIERYASVDDVGLAVNPMIVDGQVHGGIAQGAGQALMEGFSISADGQPLAGSFMDYAVPRAGDLPSFDVALAHDPTMVAANTLGVKGGGEGGVTPAIAAIVNALGDALRDYDIEDISMPASPQAIWRLIKDAKARQGAFAASEEHI
jgi:carbon-monoxide dehydrogenase large subunit